VRTRVLTVIAFLCMLATALFAWSRYESSRADLGQPAGVTAVQVRELAEWARSVRAAAQDRRAPVVAERFDASVPEDRRTLWAESIAATLARAERDEPLSVNLFRGGTVKAVWTCRGPSAGPAHLALLFRRGDDGRLRLLGPMP